MIDRDHLSDLSDQMGDDGVSEIVDIFVEETSVVMDRIATTGNATSEDLHFIKGSAANLGLRKLSQLCRAGELSVRAGKVCDTVALRDCFDASCAALRQEVG